MLPGGWGLDEARKNPSVVDWVKAVSGSARRVVRMWMSSPPHRAILLSGRYRRIGLAKRTGTLGSMRACVVTADFASKH